MNKLSKKITKFVRENQDKLQEAKFDLQKEINEYNKNRTPLEVVIDYIDIMQYRIEDKYKDIKYFFQKLFTGYSDLDRWNADRAIAKYALPLIIWTRNNTYSFPAKFKSEKQWDKILDKIIWSLNEVLTDKGEDEIIKKDKNIHVLLKKYYKKRQEGLDLFGKYFQHLWD